MARPNMRDMRDNLDANTIGKTGLANDQCHKRRILGREYEATGDLEILSALHQQDKLIEVQKAKKEHATKGPTNRHNSSGPRRKDFNSPEGFNQCGVATGRSYSSRAAERMEKKQEGFPEVSRHPTTINLMVVPLTGDLEQAEKSCRPKMKHTFSKLSEGNQVSGAFQIAMETAEYLAKIFPASELPSSLDPVNRPDEVFALLHWHGVIADPHLSKKEVRQTIKDAYPGSHRVCVARVQPERTNKNGETTHGAQGFFEYALLNKTEVKFRTSAQTKAAIVGHAKLGATWNKRNRSFSMGKSLAVTGIQIDPARVIELQHKERMDDIKKNRSKLSYAEQFLWLWLSGAIAIIRKPQPWLNCVDSISDRFLTFLSLVKNWHDDTSAESTCFYDYVDATFE